MVEKQLEMHKFLSEWILRAESCNAQKLLRKMLEQHPDHQIEILLSLVSIAENSFQMNYGYGSYQVLVAKMLIY